MSYKIKVEVFGIKDQSVGGGCSCGGGCGPTNTMGEMYDELVGFLSNTNLKDCIETQFIDVLRDNLNENKFVEVENMMNKGYRLPLTSVNGKFKFFGGISNEMIFGEIKKIVSHK